MDIHLYLLCYRTDALVASQLDPEAFGRYMALGTKKLTRGIVLFFEVDRQLQSEYLRLHDIAERCVAHPDGSPKRSKYVSIYRALEHVPLAALGRLYMTTLDGRTIGLDPSPYDAASDGSGVSLYQELCPVSPLVVSTRAPRAFVEHMTEARHALTLPRVFFADLLLDFDENGHLAGYLPYADPLHLEDCMRELAVIGAKPTKTVSRSPNIQAFYRTIRRGFFVGDATGINFYRFPEKQQLETTYARWWRSAEVAW